MSAPSDDVLAGLRMLAIVALASLIEDDDEPHTDWTEWAKDMAELVPDTLDSESQLLADTLAWLANPAA